MNAKHLQSWVLYGGQAGLPTTAGCCGQGVVSELGGPQGSPGGLGRALKAELRVEAMVAFAFLGYLGCLAGGEHSWSL